MEATILDSAQFAYLSDEYWEKLRAHWAATMVVALKAEGACEEQARREEEELGDYAQGNRPRSSTIPPIELLLQARGKALPQASGPLPLIVTREERDAYKKRSSRP